MFYNLRKNHLQK